MKVYTICMAHAGLEMDTCSGFDVYISRDLENWSEPVSVFEKFDGFWATHQFLGA